MSTSPLVLVTGANQGIGLATATSLASTGHRVLLAARTESKATAAISTVLSSNPSIPKDSLQPLVLDLTSDATIVAARNHIKTTYGSLDILINNAAITAGSRDPYDYPSDPAELRASYAATFDTNVTGVAVLIQQLLPLLRASTYHDRRIVNVSTGIGFARTAWEPNEYDAEKLQCYMYRTSKAAMNMLTIVDAKVLGKEGITVCSCSPGFCATGLNGYRGTQSAEKGAETVVRAATGGKKQEMNGMYLSVEYGDIRPW